jgi:arsenate reductase/ArsR family transcriptional regulator
MDSPGLDSALAATRALAHPARLRILSMLRTGELCVCQITEVLGLAPSTVSAHLRELKLGRLITERKQGRWVHMALSGAEAAAPWITCALDQLEDDPQVAVDDRLIEELRELGVEVLCRWGLEEARRRHPRTRKGKNQE